MLHKIFGDHKKHSDKKERQKGLTPPKQKSTPATSPGRPQDPSSSAPGLPPTPPSRNSSPGSGVKGHRHAGRLKRNFDEMDSQDNITPLKIIRTPEKSSGRPQDPSSSAPGLPPTPPSRNSSPGSRVEGHRHAGRLKRNFDEMDSQDNITPLKIIRTPEKSSGRLQDPSSSAPGLPPTPPSRNWFPGSGVKGRRYAGRLKRNFDEMDPHGNVTPPRIIRTPEKSSGRSQGPSHSALDLLTPRPTPPSRNSFSGSGVKGRRHARE
ncbi:hypothetical protein BYT27DRAFT_7264955 [Phlegmacium glaucopus]|nr:hypothetical protein BYT27DRAFT_7264955 [Phlegmacium glaucopus]